MSYPAMLDLRRLTVLIVGGGSVASRKAAGVVEADGRPTILAPQIVPALRDLVRRNELDCHVRPFRPGDTREYRIVFAATDRREINAEIAREAASHGALVNVADDPGRSTFHVPATVRQGEFVVAVSTGGASPLLSRRIRERLQTIVTPGLARAAVRLRLLRRAVHEQWPDDSDRRRSLWNELITPEFLTLAIEGRDDELEASIRRCLSQS